MVTTGRLIKCGEFTIPYSNSWDNSGMNQVFTTEDANANAIASRINLEWHTGPTHEDVSIWDLQHSVRSQLESCGKAYPPQKE
ncbi:hypothetical protein V6N11_063356 [Hibiscus sabdariffa]|uniref:Uncharacterized protein n=2 Tax=Hibiscus sabdariffa TaxID=183260 RepID=A0ABR2C1J9_9ROSI